MANECVFNSLTFVKYKRPKAFQFVILSNELTKVKLCNLQIPHNFLNFREAFEIKPKLKPSFTILNLGIMITCKYYPSIV